MDDLYILVRIYHMYSFYPNREVYRWSESLLNRTVRKHPFLIDDGILERTELSSNTAYKIVDWNKLKALVETLEM